MPLLYGLHIGAVSGLIAMLETNVRVFSAMLAGPFRLATRLVQVLPERSRNDLDSRQHEIAHNIAAVTAGRRCPAHRLAIATIERVVARRSSSSQRNLKS